MRVSRHVDWRATAHTGELQVREYARDQDQAVTIFLDLDTSDLEWFERAVDCCGVSCVAAVGARCTHSIS